MPIVGKKSFSYTKKGLTAARRESMRTGRKMRHGTLKKEATERVAAILRRLDEVSTTAAIVGIPKGLVRKRRLKRKIRSMAESLLESVWSDTVWTFAEINDLPDSSFLYVESGGDRDAEGKTVPRSLRHFPVRDADGEVNLPNLRSALSRIPQSGLSSGLKKRLRHKAGRLLKSSTE